MCPLLVNSFSLLVNSLLDCFDKERSSHYAEYIVYCFTCIFYSCNRRRCYLLVLFCASYVFAGVYCSMVRRLKQCLSLSLSLFPPLPTQYDQRCKHAGLLDLFAEDVMKYVMMYGVLIAFHDHSSSLQAIFVLSWVMQ